MRQYSAPGKLVLAGEYAVLYGAPAIAMAVDRRAVVTVRNANARDGRLRSGGLFAEARYRLDNGRIRWLCGEQESALVAEVMGESVVTAALDIDIDSAAFRDDAGRKFGVGSSAAVAVALAAALNDDAGEGLSSLFDRAFRAHRRWQAGGSGIDVACATQGGLIAYQAKPPRITPLEWPNGLCYRLIWTGQSSATAPRVAKANRVASAAARQRFVRHATHMATHWQSGDAAEVIDGYPAYVDALTAFSDACGLDVFAGGHAAILEAARKAGIIYKPCGAGGGDIGIALSTDDDRLRQFVRDNALRDLSGRLDSRGVAREHR